MPYDDAVRESLAFSFKLCGAAFASVFGGIYLHKLVYGEPPYPKVKLGNKLYALRQR